MLAIPRLQRRRSALGGGLVCFGLLRNHEMTRYRFSRWEPNVAKTTCPCDEIPEDAKPHGAPCYLRVQHHGDEPAPLARLVELTIPNREHVLLREHRSRAEPI